MEIEQRLLAILVQLGVIVLTARVFASLFRKLKQPAVIGEILAGVALGPSIFGLAFPELWSSIFIPTTTPLGHEVMTVLEIMSQIGLVLLLFIIGLEFDFTHLKTNLQKAFGISAAGILLPMTLGILLGFYLHPRTGAEVNRTGFVLFLGISMSITALPVLARMMQELRITRTRIGTITITAAAGDDAMGWILLAAISALITSSFHLLITVRMILLTIVYALFLIFVAGPILRAVLRKSLDQNHGQIEGMLLAVLLVLLFCSAIITSWIGIFAIFGAFLFGAILSPEQRIKQAASRTFQEFVTIFFLPIFFTYTGLRTNISLLENPDQWIVAGIVGLTAIVAKFGGCSLAARITGFNGKESLLIGTMMNTRGLMELIVLNVGFDLGVIPPELFTILVMMALLTTIMTLPLLYLFRKNTELQPCLEKWWQRK